MTVVATVATIQEEGGGEAEGLEPESESEEVGNIYDGFGIAIEAAR